MDLEKVLDEFEYNESELHKRNLIRSSVHCVDDLNLCNPYFDRQGRDDSTSCNEQLSGSFQSGSYLVFLNSSLFYVGIKWETIGDQSDVIRLLTVQFTHCPMSLYKELSLVSSPRVAV